MGQLLKQSTAVNLTVLMVDSADHVTGKTGLTLTIYATKAGGTPAAITPTVTELDSTNVKGIYKLALTTGHTDTLGELELHITSTGADPTDVTHQVVLDLPGIAQTGDNYARIGAPAGASIAADIATRLATSGYTAPPSSATISTAVVDQALSGHTTAGTVGAALQSAGSAGDPWATLLPGAYGAGTAGKLVADNVDAKISLVKAKTDNLPASPAAVSDIPTATQNSVAVVDQALSGHTTAGTVGAALSAAGAAADPWATPLPGAYGAGTAGIIIGNLPDANANADALLDRAAGVETNRTMRQALRLMLAALAGKLSGAATTTVTIRDTNDTKNRITATVDTSGNRSAVTYDQS